MPGSPDQCDKPKSAESRPIAELLRDAARRLESVSDSARLDAELLLARAIDMPRSYLIAHPDDRLDLAAIGRLEQTLERRLAGEPMAYIRGTQEFWSLELVVSPATLVPRPETERLVELALTEMPRRWDRPVLDLGTGSGAVALAIASERPLADVVAVDVSAEALAVARLNARQLAIGNVTFVAGDWTAPVAERRFPLIVSNPPYVRDDDPALDALAAEPALALRAGSDGLAAIRRLAAECVAIIEDGGVLIVEHGYDQREAVAAILADRGWQSIRCYDDYAGQPRVTCARYATGERPEP
jgi:release factor glutamine methyltransferase